MKSIATTGLIITSNESANTAEIQTEILIQASAEEVWSALTDFENYPLWNPFIKSLRGDVRVGKKIKVFIQPPGARGMTFKPMVLVFEEQRELIWLGKLFVSGLFDGEHRCQIIDHGNGTTTFRQSEKFKGLLVPLFKKQLSDKTRRGFEAMNVKLKELVERQTIN